ncbi:unnamed protein product [Linum tenue]|uniref:Agenet domain-containing protein n=1 Tax=Linum tenue TaxID=586396 RepID=A0AAV0R7W2_9ROSI|nr:unnamed protein product [Linum tenue]
MERFGSAPALSPSEEAMYVSWEEVSATSDTGRAEVRYYLRRKDGGADLAVVGKEKSLRHVSYRYGNRIRSLSDSMGPLLKLRTRHEVIDWLNSIVSDSSHQQSSVLAKPLSSSYARSSDFLNIKDPQSLKISPVTRAFSWLGSPWMCRRKRKHFPSFHRNGVKISVFDFVYVLAEEGKRLVAYLEDMYEDSKGNGLAVILSPQHFQKFQSVAAHTRMDPFMCDHMFEDDEVKPFNVTRVKGYWNQEIVRHMYPVSGSTKDQAALQQFDRDVEIRPRKRHCRSRDNEAKAKANPAEHLKVGHEVEVLSQDSGIRGCWFRARIIKKHKDKVKVRYADIQDAADEAKKLEEWMLASRVASPDKLGIRIAGRKTVRPAPELDEECLFDVKPGAAVDVWWHDGWWEGIVVEMDSEQKIRVHFPGLFKLILCLFIVQWREQGRSVVRSNLRQSQEWLENGWIKLKARPENVDSILSQSLSKPRVSQPVASKMARPILSDPKHHSMKVETNSSSRSGSEQQHSRKVETDSSKLGLDSRSDDDRNEESKKVVLDLSKDDLLTKLRWKSSRKRRRRVRWWWKHLLLTSRAFRKFKPEPKVEAVEAVYHHWNAWDTVPWRARMALVVRQHKEENYVKSKKKNNKRSMSVPGISSLASIESLSMPLVCPGGGDISRYQCAQCQRRVAEAISRRVWALMGTVTFLLFLFMDSLFTITCGTESVTVNLVEKQVTLTCTYPGPGPGGGGRVVYRNPLSRIAIISRRILGSSSSSSSSKRY